MPKPGLILSPEATAYLQSGFNRICKLVSVTLGPLQGGVLVSNDQRDGYPEIVEDAGMIARRIISLPDQRENPGAMLARSMVWRARQRAGDGGAITAVLARAILSEARRFAVAGAHSMMLARGIKLATNVAKNALLQLSRPARLPEWYGSAIANNDYYAVARSVTGDDALSHILSEMIELLGKHAHIHVESYLAPYLEREYLDGGIWAASLASPYLSTSPGEAIQHECHIAVFNGVISTIDQIYPILRSLENREQKNILIVATKIHDNALNTIVATHQKGEIKIVAATLTSAGLKVLQDFQDLALLSGATLFSQEAGETLECFNETHLGWARRVELNGTELLLAGGRGEPERIQKEIENIQTMQKSSVAENDDEGRLQARLARLSGSTGVLKIGAHSENQRALLRQKAEQAIKVLQGVTFDGIAPGGGTAYLHCLPALQALVHSSLDVTMGIRAVQRALKAPFLKILENAGIDGAEYYCDLISSLPPGAYFDVVERKVVSAEEVSLFDPARMLSVALETAASSAMMVLNTDAIILKRNPIVSYEP